MKAPRLTVIHQFVLLIPLLLFCNQSFSQSIVLSPQTGPPTTKTLVAGSGFPVFGAIDIYFDTTSVATVNADSNGAFSKIAILIPSSAFPGKHWVNALAHSANASAQASFLVRTNWSQSRFAPDHLGLNPYENILSTTTVSGLRPKWTFDTGANTCGGPTVVDGVVYAAGWDQNLYAMNASSGALLWNYFTGDTMCGTPAVIDGVVYTGTYSGRVLALNAGTGALLWSFPRPTANGVTVINGVVYVVSGNYGNGDIFALDAKSGAEIWHYHNGADTIASPAVVDGRLYFGDQNGLHALNANTGAPLWSFPAGDLYNGSPAVANGVVYVASSDRHLYAVNASTGAKLWTYTAAGELQQAPAVANGVVYVIDYFGDLLNTASLYALNADTGATLWTYMGGMYGSPAVANGVVYAGSIDHNIYAFDAKTGAKLWSYLAPGGRGSVFNPTVADGGLYVIVNGSTLDSPAKVYAFGLPGDTTPPVTAASVSGAKGNNGWYKGSVIVTFNATDPDSTVAATYFSLDGGKYQAYKAPFTIQNDGVHRLSFYSLDPAGNREKARVLTIKIDATPPAISVAANPAILWPPNGKMVNVTLWGRITDATSGVNPSSSLFRVTDEYGSIHPTGTVIVSANGNYSFVVSLRASRLGSDRDGRLYTLTVSAQDVAGNGSSASGRAIVPHDRGGIRNNLH